MIYSKNNKNDKNAAQIRRLLNQAVLDHKTCEKFKCGGNYIYEYIYCSHHIPYILSGVKRRIPCHVGKYTNFLKLLRGIPI